MLLGCPRCLLLVIRFVTGAVHVQALLRQEALIKEEEEASRAAGERSARKAEADKERRAKKKVCSRSACLLGSCLMMCFRCTRVIQSCLLYQSSDHA
jgi:hypothetical protein